MEAITLLFVAALVLAGLFLTVSVRKDILSNRRLERHRRREDWRRVRGR